MESQMENEKAVALWNKIIKGAMKLPGVRQNREKFLRKELAAMYNTQQIDKIISGDITKYVTKKQIDRIANGCIKYHLTVVCSTSALAGIPGGWAMAGTIPADITQFYGHVFALTQKLMYLYGYPDITSDDDLSDGVAAIMTIFTGIMMGCQAIDGAVKNGLKAFAKQVAVRLPKQALTKGVIYPIVKKVAMWLGVKLTKDSFAKGVSKIIPLVGAPISAGLTYFTFKPMAKRLKEFLDEQYLNSHSFYFGVPQKNTVKIN